MQIPEIGVLVAIFYTFALYSILYKPNIFYKFTVATLIGAASSYWAIFALNSSIDIIQTRLALQDYSIILALLVGLLLFTSFKSDISYLSRYPVMVITSVGAIVAVRGMLSAQLVEPMMGIIKPLFVPGNLLDSFNNIIIIACALTALFYFTFTREYKGVVTSIHRAGRISILVGLGASYGTQLFSRSSLFIGRMQWLIDPSRIMGTIILTVAVIGFILYDKFLEGKSK